MNNLDWLESEFINKAQVAYALYGANTKQEKAIAKVRLNNKTSKTINPKHRRSLSEEEIKKLDEIRKKIINMLA